MIILTVFLLIMNQTKFHLVHNQKGGLFLVNDTQTSPPPWKVDELDVWYKKMCNVL